MSSTVRTSTTLRVLVSDGNGNKEKCLAFADENDPSSGIDLSPSTKTFVYLAILPKKNEGILKVLNKVSC